ncbi:MAG: cytochrome c oxidase subunit 3 [Cyclobacteriaceae bacterium]
MSEENRNIKQTKTSSTLNRIEKIHPHKMILYLFILGSSIIFIFMLVAYFFNMPDNSLYQFTFPKVFIISLIIMLLSSFSLSHMSYAVEKEQLTRLRNYMLIAFILGLSFAIFQYIGWQQLKNQDLFLAGKAAPTYLYLITGMHLVHFTSAMIMLSIYMIDVYRFEKDPVKILIFVTNPYEQTKLEILNTYWQYLNILWMILFFYFLYIL